MSAILPTRLGIWLRGKASTMAHPPPAQPKSDTPAKKNAKRLAPRTRAFFDLP
jgi:hypothetical protein